MDTLRQDLRYALRMLAKAPGVTLAAVLSLALGIGANTTLFTWVSAALLNPISGVPEADNLAVLTSTQGREEGRSLSHLDFLDYRETPGLKGAIAQDELTLTLGADGRADRVWALIVSDDYFDVLGVRAAVGRTFGRDDGRAGVPLVVISHGLWQRRFAGDPTVVGRPITINTQPFTVAGVAPAAFHGTTVGLTVDAWVPLSAQRAVLPGDRLSQRGHRWLQVLVRLAPGTSLKQAQAALSTTAARLAATYPEDKGLDVAVTRFWNAPVGASKLLGPVLLVLWAVVALVLLIACANVANLLLTRATMRRREIGVRLALGASRARLVRQLLTESTLLALLGGAAGVLVAVWGSGLLRTFVPPTDFPISLTPALDGRALAFALLLSIGTVFVFGLVPALQASRVGVAGRLREEQASVVGGSGGRLRGVLVAGQLALSVLLLVSAGLLVRSLRHAETMDAGFDPRGVLLASVDLFASGYDKDSGRRLFASAVESLRRLPGVTAVSLVRRAPLGFGGSSSSTMSVDGYDAPPDEPAWAFTHVVGPDFFHTMGGTILRGRDLTAADSEAAPRVVVVDETAAQRYWAGREALGSRLRLGDTWYTVVGVARTMKHRQLSEAPGPHVFLPVLQSYQPQATFLVRTDRGTAAVSAEVIGGLRAIDPGLPVFNVVPFEEHVQAARFQPRMAGSLLAGFGALALLLAAVGLYGVLAFAVGQRTREIGIRMALGGRARDIYLLVARQGFALIGTGVLVGLASAAAATRVLRSMLIGVSPTDPLTFVLVAGVLVAVALMACAIPARRAAGVDPVVALRYE
jgi:predicted permease